MTTALVEAFTAKLDESLTRERLFREDFTHSIVADLTNKVESMLQERQSSDHANAEIIARLEAALTQERMFREDFTRLIAAEMRGYVDQRLTQAMSRMPMHWPEGGRVFMHTVDGHRLYLDSSEPFMALHIAEHGEWERPVRDLLRALLRPGDLYVDIGANIGVHVLFASMLVGPEGKVIAVEPHPTIGRLLTDNLEINGLLERVKVIAAAASDSKGKTSFEYFPQHSAMSGFRVSAERIADFRGTPETIEVSTVTLDSIVSEAGRAPALVKIDVEGFEHLVLKGAKKVLASGEDTAFLIEYGRDLVASLLDDSIVGKISAMFEAQGLMPYRVSESGPVALSHDGFRREIGGDYLFIRPGGRHAQALGLD